MRLETVRDAGAVVLNMDQDVIAGLLADDADLGPDLRILDRVVDQDAASL